MKSSRRVEAASPDVLAKITTEGGKVWDKGGLMGTMRYSISAVFAASITAMLGSNPAYAGEPEASSSEVPAPDADEFGPGGRYEPTSSKAPPSDELPEIEAPQESEPEPAPAPSPRDAPFRRHGVGMRGGISVIPTWILSRWVDAHTNALCRGDAVGDFAASRGLLETDGCNFYVGAQYVYRRSRIFDIVGTMGYQRVHAPEGYWLDELGSTVAGVTGNPLAGADYTEIDLHLLQIGVDFIARFPIIVRDDIEFGLGGGGGVGLGVVFGGIYQTPIGSAPQGYSPQTGAQAGSCQTIQDLGDFTRCTPRYDPDEDPDGVPPDPSELDTPNPGLFATCTEGNCSKNDLRAFGYRQKNGDVPPVVPVPNLMLSARVIIKDTVGITLDGGFSTGFFFGGSVAYFFGEPK